MADRIRGITIELNGETTGLQKALSNVTKESMSIQKELKDVDRLLKFDPGNTEAIAQKQQLLSKQIENTSQKLKALKDAQSQVDEQFSKSEINEKQYMAFQREIQFSEKELSNLENKLKTTNPELKSFGDKATEAGEKLNKVGTNVSSVGSNLTMGVTVPLLGVAAAAVKVGNDFESQMSRVKAISGATGEDFEKLNQQALDLGQSTAFSASEVAQGMENLASAGFTTNEIMNAMPGLLDLAASSGEDLATSSDIAASTLRGFGLEASQAGHVADVLAKNASATNAAVSDTGEAMKYVAPAAKAAGLSLEEVTAAIGIMANSGIKGSQAGTTLRSALTRLASPSKEAATAMESIGFSAFDSEGKMIPLKDMIEKLKTSMAGLSDQEKQDKIATIFGQESMSGILTLIDSGSEGLETLTKSLNDSNGAAAEMATTMQDNAKSGIDQMLGALETAGIKIQQALAPAITAIANSIGNLATAFSNLSPTAQKIILIIAGIIASIGPILIFIGKIITAISALTPIIATISGAIGVVTTGAAAATPAIGALAAVFTFLTGPIGIAIVAITAMVAAITYLWNTNEGFRTAIIEAWRAIATTASEVWNGIVNFFTVTIPAALQGFIDFITNNWAELLLLIVNPFAGAFALLYKNCDDFRNFVNEFVETVKQFFIDSWNGIVTFFTESVPAWLESMFAWFGELPNKIAYGLGQAIGNIIKWGTDVINYLTTNVPVWIENISTWFSELPGKIWTWLVNVVTNLGTWGSNVISWISSNVSSWITNIVNYFSQLPSQIWNWLVQVVSNIGTWGSNMLSTAKEGMQNVFDGIVNAFTNLPSKMLEIGKNIVDGIKNGIKNAWEGMTGWIGGLCDSFTQGVKDALDIHSPSRVMRVLGEYTGEGFGLGIGDTVNSISKQADNLASAAIPNLGTNSYDMGVNYSPIGNNNIASSTSSLDLILSKMESMTQAIANMKIIMDSKQVGKLVTPSVNNNLAFNNDRRGF